MHPGCSRTHPGCSPDAPCPGCSPDAPCPGCSPDVTCPGAHRLLVLKRRRSAPLLSMGSSQNKSRMRVCFWHELLSCAGSSEDGTLLRLCFVPQQQQQRGCVLPPLFLARLSATAQQAPADTDADARV